MITIKKDTTYTLVIEGNEYALTPKEINNLHEEITIFINNNYEELNETD